LVPETGDQATEEDPLSMNWNLRRLAAATAVAGTVIVGGAGWAAAQDDPSTSDSPGATSEEPGTHDRGSPGDSGSAESRHGDCHGTAGDESAEASAFAA
jgi:hypothetical protein